jgi:hypothetical protein
MDTAAEIVNRIQRETNLLLHLDCNWQKESIRLNVQMRELKARCAELEGRLASIATALGVSPEELDRRCK